MFTVITSEIRWFLEGKLPVEVERWFGDLGKQVITEPDRTDTYLILPETREAGIKVRQGRVEIKKLLGEKGIIETGKNVGGKNERWQKWSFDVEQSGKLPVSFMLKSLNWIAVKKKRKLHRFEVKGDRLHPLEANDSFPANGAHIELAHVTLANNPWWTLGLEAFGNESNIETNLKLLAETLLSNCPFGYFKEGQSVSYPEWLADNIMIEY